MGDQEAESLALANALPGIVTKRTPEALNKEIKASVNISDNAVTTPDANSVQDSVLSQQIKRNEKQIIVTWTKEEERRVVRKADFILLPLFSLMFTWMAIDRTNVSGVLTSTFLADTGMTRDQANIGISLLWLGIVLLEIPSNIVLHRIGPHYWIPAQVIIWGLIEVLQMFVRNASGWYAARIFLGLAESGFIPGGLYTLSRWYTRDEITKRTTIFFFGPSISAAFGSLISAGALSIADKRGLAGWQWIFIICGVSTIATGILAFALVPRSPHHTGHLFGGLIKTRGWLTEREADVFVARLLLSDPLKGQSSTMKITLKDVTDVLLDRTTWPYLIVCLSGLQAVNGLSTWGATIIQSLGFSSVRANLLNSPAPLLASIFGVALASVVDRTKRFGYAIIFVAIWTLAGLIALYHLPVTTKSSWSFYAAYVVTQASPSWQPINVTWLSLNTKTPQQRAIAYAIYIGCSNLGGTYGNQVFRGSDAPLYRKAWAACLALGAVWLAVVLLQTIAFRIASYRYSRRIGNAPELEPRTLYYDKQGRAHRYYW
ncbi:major facilitator superfamily domain-containing protein [Truncatella angustata]|uniref:Major facilitator superfamily domain-containing protein n=1 Tax=Truncatella angustata TaxID=152316 RepID=A0A9P8UM81_9PEZI|nr:major facilitator superfamily domain-containing protein [Truncatella angustata]KAH6654748.1 major facilitator superfamily domain-containing protein [Truncatella angustata]